MIDTIKYMSVNYIVTEVEDLTMPEDANQDAYGTVDYGLGMIRLNSVQPPIIAWQTLFHEIVHIILRHSGNIDHDENEIERYAYGFLHLLKENPDLQKLLLKETK